MFAQSGMAWAQQTALGPSDAANGNEFGWSVAIQGSTVFVGAPGRKSSAGASYQFVRIVILSAVIWAQGPVLTPSDAAAGDAFGVSLAISGSTLVVGAAGKDSSRGAAYVFVDTNKGWSQQAELTASDATAGDRFGYSVAISGSRVVIGAPSKNSRAGAAYGFLLSGSTWFQQTEISASDPAADNYFGDSVAVSSATAVVGAYGKNSGTGAAYTFALPVQQLELSASDGAANDQFGYSVAISGSTAVIGAPSKNSSAGLAYVFVRSGSTWSRQAELTASDAAPNDQFGWSVAISGSTAIIGADHHKSHAGAAYVFVQSGSTWSQQAELTASDSSANDDFGYSVSVSGSTAVVGAPGVNLGAGAAYVFLQSGSAWSQQAKLTAGLGGINLGSSVAISGPTIVVGAPFSSKGAAYVFVDSTKGWSQQAELTASDAATGDQFGFSVAISGVTAVIGANAKNHQAGAAYVFARSGNAWSQQAKLTASDAAAYDGFGRSVAIYGSTVVIGSPDGNGAAYLFVPSGSAWSQQAKVVASDAVQEGQFGVSVAIFGSVAVIGAQYQNSDKGAAYLFGNL